MRWGIPDVAWCWLAGLAGAVVLVGVAAAAAGGEPGDDPPVVLLAAFAGQYGGIALALAVVARRKGRGGLAADFGFGVAARDWPFLLAGVGLQVALGLALRPLADLAGDGDRQEVVRQVQDAAGLELVLLGLAAAVLAPVLEEVLFRGLLLRSLLRRMPAAPAVAVSALVFGLVHLTDWSLGTAVVLPGLVAVGVVAGVQAVRTGSLSRPILLHVGFNALVVVAAFAD